MYSSHNTTTFSPNPILSWGIVFVEVLAVIGVYFYLKSRVKYNETFSGLGWGFFAGLFMGGIGDLIFYGLMSSLLSEHLSKGNKGKPKSKQDKNTATIKNLKKKLGIGLILSFIVHIIIRSLIVLAAN